MMDQENMELLEKFFRISRLLHQNHRHIAELCGASCRGQGRVLSMLKAYPNISQKELSALLDIRAQSLGELLARLERSGCISRTAVEDDRRALNIQLTSKGRAAAEQAEQNKRESAALFNCLSAEEKSALNSLVDHLSLEFEKQAEKAADLAQATFQRRHRGE